MFFDPIPILGLSLCSEMSTSRSISGQTAGRQTRTSAATAVALSALNQYGCMVLNQYGLHHPVLEQRNLHNYQNHHATAAATAAAAAAAFELPLALVFALQRATSKATQHAYGNCGFH